MIEYRWGYPEEFAEVAHFLSRTIARDPRYVSHGEVQTGLSPDGVNWAANLDALMAEDLRDIGDDRSVAVARGEGGLVGAAIVLWVREARVSYLVLEDLAVAPEMRSAGVGAKLVEFIEAAGRERGMDWAFLESGLGNEGAHSFFERHGFRPMSKVFSKRLS